MTIPRQPQSTTASAARRAVLAVLVCCQFAASGGGFVVPGRVAKDASRPFPCMNRPCGCLTYDECWAGDCCCFTLREKVAWAEANDLAPPAHAVRVACDRGKPKASCCEPAPEPERCPLCEKPAGKKSCPPAEALTFRWVLGITAQQCKSGPSAGWWFATPAVPPEFLTAWTFEWVAAGTVPANDSAPFFIPSRPDSPPPRV